MFSKCRLKALFLKSALWPPTRCVNARSTADVGHGAESSSGTIDASASGAAGRVQHARGVPN
eukprot:422645-Prymnesium_polylepis.4